ncbi:hypothetical protein [Trichloromonas sp.]|uniref:hypothetical protein n=1 Tax=Trichloromonas sp. TaxID=3069249 RepID=UPI002A4CC692|nr:hypothetical protein [Trichloromonas sp.]
MSNKRKTKEQVINDFNKVHNNLYDYSLMNYINNKTKIKIICHKHGVFEQRPDDHLSGHGCYLCSKTLKRDNDYIIKKSNITHNFKYDYSLVNYINAKTKIRIICKEHGIFEQNPIDHINGSGCPKCAKNNKIIRDEYINRCNLKHDFKYDYSLVNLINLTSKIKIICDEHGEFEQNAQNHMNGSGCPKCKLSKNEKIIKSFFEKNNILYESQKMFEGCEYKRKLKFDFYLPNYNICVEYDGEQHFKKYRFEKNKKNLMTRQLRDQIKTEYCQNNNIKLIRIRYDQNIEDILKNEIPFK